MNESYEEVRLAFAAVRLGFSWANNHAMLRKVGWPARSNLEDIKLWVRMARGGYSEASRETIDDYTERHG